MGIFKFGHWGTAVIPLERSCRVDDPCASTVPLCWPSERASIPPPAYACLSTRARFLELSAALRGRKKSPVDDKSHASPGPLLGELGQSLFDVTKARILEQAWVPHGEMLEGEKLSRVLC